MAFCERTGKSLPTPDVDVIERSKGTAKSEADADETARLNDALARAKEKADFIVIDTPGNDTTLSRVGHAAADTLVTPLNDSFLDFDLLAKFDPDSLEIKGPSLYSEFVWDCRKRRLMAHRANLDWVVMRNRVPSAEMRNKRRVAQAVEQLSSRVGCRISPGFSDRVIFRELFPLGLTMLDLPVRGLGMPLTMSHIAARQEVRELLAMLRLPGLEKVAEKVAANACSVRFQFRNASVATRALGAFDSMGGFAVPERSCRPSSSGLCCLWCCFCWRRLTLAPGRRIWSRGSDFREVCSWGLSTVALAVMGRIFLASLAAAGAWALLTGTMPPWLGGPRSPGEAGGSREMPPSRKGTMSRSEALHVLGLEPGATEEQIRAAHRRLIVQIHPDKGGTSYLAAKINEAKDVLLRR